MSRRLKDARIKAGFDHAKEAADAMGVAVASYIQHESGLRGFRRDSAEKYARRFKVTPEWLLFGRGGPVKAHHVPDVETIEEMVRIVVDREVRMDTRTSDLPRILAPALHEQLARLEADRAAQATAGEGIAPGKGARSRPATTPAESEGSRTP